MLIVNYLQSLLSKGLQLKLIEILVISIEKTFAGHFSTGLVLYSDDQNVLCADWEAKFLTIVKRLNMLGQPR